jgi:hypothetical protein
VDARDKRGHDALVVAAVPREGLCLSTRRSFAFASKRAIVTELDSFPILH